MELLLKYRANVGVGGIYSKGDRSTRFRASEYRTEARSFLARMKAELSSGDHRRDLPGPLSWLVRGART